MSSTEDICRVVKNLVWIHTSGFRPCCTYKVDGPKATMPDLMQVTEDVLRIIFEEEVRQLWVLQHSFPCGRRHYGLDMG